MNCLIIIDSSSARLEKEKIEMCMHFRHDWMIAGGKYKIGNLQHACCPNMIDPSPEHCLAPIHESEAQQDTCCSRTA